MTRVLCLAALVLALAPLRSADAACTDPAAVAAARAQVDADCPCAAAATHGEHVRCARAVAQARIAAALLPRNCLGSVVRCSAKSTCGKPGAVTCCRPDRHGGTKCSIKKDAARCLAAGGCVGASATCCDACVGGGCATTTTVTTTTSPPPTLPPCGDGSASGCCLGDFDTQPGSTPPGTCGFEVKGPDCTVQMFRQSCLDRGPGFTWIPTLCPDPLCGPTTGCCADVSSFNGADLGTFGAPIDPETAAQGAAACLQIGGTPIESRCP